MSFYRSSSSPYEEYDVFLSFSEDDSMKAHVTDLLNSLANTELIVNNLRGVKIGEEGLFIQKQNFERQQKLEKLMYSDLPQDSHYRQDRGYCRADSSKLAVIVVSKSYPTSVLCLNELQTIVDDHDKRGIPFLPVFYGVDPSDVRNQSGEFAEPFRKLDEEYPAEKVQAWRSALTKLTNILGLDSRYWSKEEKVIDLITEEILSLTKKKPMEPFSTKPPKELVGMDRQMQVLYELLDLKATKEVRLIGIWGLGGIGKTTLARYAYEQLSTNFHAHMFVDNSKMTHHQEGAETAGKSSNVSTDVIKSIVGLRIGLLVIDSVDNVEQLKDIADIVSWCGLGSRVILVTEDKNLLDQFGVEHVYEVESLRYDEALQIFSQSAFQKQNPPTSFQSLSLRAVQIASFLPLALKIIGSSLQGKDEKEWEKELHKFERDQEKTIMDIMKKSYTR